MKRAEGDGRLALAVILGCLGTAALFEVLTVFATQDKTVRAASPWQEDPYDAVVSLAMFTVPMLALVIAVRLLAWRAPGGPDRAQQTIRASACMMALVGLTLAFEWAAVVNGAQRSSWGSWTSVLIGGLVVASLSTAVVTALLVRCRRPRRSAGHWQHDWLGDVVLAARRVPGLRRWATPEPVAWVRRRAMTVFVTVSVLAALVIIGALAVGEAWTDPLLFAWALTVETTSNLAFCVITNAIAGFIARPPRTVVRRRVEASVVAGCVAIQVTTAFRDPLWQLGGGGELTSVPAVVVLTLGAGVITALVTAALLSTRARGRPAPAS